MITVTANGRATRDVEMYGGSVKVAKTGMAVRNIGAKPGEKDADFYDIVAFGQKADTLKNLVGKGDMFLVSGTQRIKEYNGRHYVEITADRIEVFFNKAKVDGEQPVNVPNTEETDDLPF